MMTPSIVSLDGTGDPAADGCTASYSTAWTYHQSYGDDFSADQEYYRLDADEADGWQFDHFEYTQEERYYGSIVGTRKQSPTFSPFPKEDEPQQYPWHYLFEETDIQEGEVVYTARIIRCVAVFRKSAKQSSITVTTSASPVAGGTTMPTTETRTGQVGQSETFTLVATANKGYEFKRWEDDGGSLVSKSETTSVTKTYTENPQTFNYTAIFRKLTGLILRNASGKILRGASGNILRDD